MKKVFTTSVLFTFLAVVAYFSKPSEEKCLEESKEIFKKGKLSYTVQTLPAKVNTEIFTETAVTSFIKSLEIKDRFLYRDVYQTKINKKTKIGWAAFGWVTIDLK